MSARTKNRAKFAFHGRPFVWWIDGDRWLRIASADKRFVVAYPLARAVGEPAVLVVHGHEFLGLTTGPRPVYLLIPEPTARSIGAWVEQLLAWAFDPRHDLVPTSGPPRSL